MYFYITQTRHFRLRACLRTRKELFFLVNGQSSTYQMIVKGQIGNLHPAGEQVTSLRATSYFSRNLACVSPLTSALLTVLVDKFKGPTMLSTAQTIIGMQERKLKFSRFGSSQLMGGHTTSSRASTSTSLQKCWVKP